MEAISKNIINYNIINILKIIPRFLHAKLK